LTQKSIHLSIEVSQHEGCTIVTTHLRLQPHVRIIERRGFLNMVALSRSARSALTDSGGLQKETCGQRVPCIAWRQEMPRGAVLTARG